MAGPSTPPIPATAPEETLADRMAALCKAEGNQPDALLNILHAVQAQYGYVPRAALPPIAEALNLSRAEVYGVVSFYHDFHDTPPARHNIKLCRAEACQAVGARAAIAHAQQQLGIGLGETRTDSAVRLEAVYCLGNCALGPAALVDGVLHARMTPDRLDPLFAGLGLVAVHAPEAAE